MYIPSDLCPHCGKALSSISWQPWNAATAKDVSGHYYLTAKVSRTMQFIPTAADLVIDLRGFIVAFNAIKAGLNAVITFFLYKSVSKLLKLFDVKE